MTETKRYVLRNPEIVRNAVGAILEAGKDWTVTISPPKRSLDQNALMWCCLHDVAKAKPEGRNWTVETWKAAFLHSLGHQVMFAEGLDGSGPFPVGFHSSKLNKSQMSDLITVIQEYGDRHQIEWTETKKRGFWDE